MKIGMQTWGSNGDIRPFLALASELKQAGHEVCFIVSSIDNRSYQEECLKLGVHYQQVPEHIDFDLEDFAQRSFRMFPLQWLKALLNEAFFPCEAQVYEAAQQLANKHDLLIGHHFLYPLKLAAKQAGKPFFSITFCHSAIPDASQALFALPNLGNNLNALSWRLMETVFNWALKKPLSQLWLNAGFAVPKNMLSEHLTSQSLNLVAVDPVFCPSHIHWPSHHQACGFLDFKEDSHDWQMPKDLTEFLAQGSAPVYMTFGSLQQAVPEWSMDLFLAAVALTGCRAIIQTSSNRFPAGSRQNNVYFIGRHPHQPVFKHCVAVVHHGGAGTSHAATRSGCPSIVIPFMTEQLFWAKQLQKLKLAAKPLPAKQVKGKDLAKGLRAILDNDQFKRQAVDIAKQMHVQSSTQLAVKLITEKYLEST